MNAINPSHLSLFAALALLRYRRIVGGPELEKAAEIRQKAFNGSDLYYPKFDHPVIDEADFSDRNYLIGLYAGDTMVATVRLGVLDRNNPDTQAAKMFGSVLRPLVDQGQRFIDPGRLAVDPDYTNQFPSLPIFLMRTALIATSYFRADQGLGVIKKAHQGFYRRVFLSTQMSGPIPVDGFTSDLYLHGSAIENYPRVIERYPILNYNTREQIALFADVPAGQGASDPIMPSAPEVVGLDVASIPEMLSARVA